VHDTTLTRTTDVEQVFPDRAPWNVGDFTLAAIHDAGMEAHVWTVNDGAGMRRATAWRVDGITTNYPQVLRDLLRQR
jgi:glycerophosphoryl diester phosphodiesterase